MRSEPSRVPITRTEYELFARSGVFEDARVELLHGRIVGMSPIGGPHRRCVCLLARILRGALAQRAHVDVQSSFAAAHESEPEPDLLVAPLGEYGDAPPCRAWLVVEVADRSLAHDRAKARLYAAAHVNEYWIVNLIDRLVEVHREPMGERYARTTRHGRSDVLKLERFGDVAVHLGEVLPPARH